MELIRGTDLQEAWLGGSLSTQRKEDIMRQLAGFVKELRDLKPPKEGVVGSVDLGPCLDHRIGSSPVGPFSNYQEFHSFLRRYIPLEDCTEVFGEAVTLCHSLKYRSVFSHADLSPRNTMVADGKVVALIDWAFAGWWPEYWEFTKAHFGLMDMCDWYDKLGLVMTRYEKELVTERALWRQCDQPGTVQETYQ